VIPSASVASFLGWNDPLVVAAVVLETLACISAVLGFWWWMGRDRWLGDVAYLRGDGSAEIKPPFSHETVMPELEPPLVPGSQRPLRPAEMGVLIRERVLQARNRVVEVVAPADEVLGACGLGELKVQLSRASTAA
jgi:hypothetical protein